MKALSVAVAALALSAGSVVLTLDRTRQHVNSYAPARTCTPPLGRETMSARPVPLVYAQRDLSGPPFYGACNVPARPVVWITGTPVRTDGSTEISVEFYIAAAEPDVNSSVVAYLYDGSRSLGALTDSSTMNLQGGARDATTMYARVYLTPPSGVHDYRIVLAAVGGYSNPVYAGCNRLGGVPCWRPSYLRVTPS